MDESTNSRKLDHLRIITDHQDVDRHGGYFEALRLKHRALPEIDYSEIDTSVEFLGKKLSFPLLISSMTGGDHEQLKRINSNLAKAAEATGVAMGVGSQRVMFTHPKATESFDIRHLAPQTILISNLGAVQLNNGFGLEECQKSIDVLQADALFLHLNPLQEAIQPEGNLNFSGLAKKIGFIAKNVSCPVIIKEVGCGISVEDAILLQQEGVHIFDVAGLGGTSWSRVEHYRNPSGNQMGVTFSDWGTPTPQALKELASLDHVILIGSGGIRSGVDMVKALALGASLCGIAGPFLQRAQESAESVIHYIECLREEFTRTLFLVGKRNAAQVCGDCSIFAHCFM